MNQHKIVNYDYKPNTILIVQAGPGTGKTYTLAQRINKLLDDIKPEEILVLSFTNKTVDLLKKLINDEVIVKTFHGYASKIIEKYYKPYFPNRVSLKLLDEISWSSFKKLFSFGNKFDLAVKDVKFGLSIEDAAKKYKINGGKLKNVIKYLNENGLVRYYDFLSTAIEILQISDGQIDEIANIKVVIIDEYQDLHPEIIDFIEEIAMYGSPKHLTFLGDKQQNIYEFIGANSTLQENLFQRLGKRKELYLNQSFRLTPEIVEYVKKIHPVEITSMKESLHSPIIFSDHYFIIKEIERLILGSGGLIKFDDILILARSNAQVEEIGKLLKNYSLPVSLKLDPQWMKSRIYIFLDILNVLNESHGSDFAILSILMKLGYPKQKLNKIFKKYVMNKQAITHSSEIKSFTDILNEVKNLTTPLDVMLSLSRIVNRASMLKEYINHESSQDIKSFYNSLKRSYNESPNDFINHFLSNYINDYEECNAVNISTIHKAKGLEYPIVFLLNPNIERNLKYVAATRTKSLLYIQGDKTENTINEEVIRKVTNDLGRRLILNNVALGKKVLQKLK
ncbi:unnamed protein product [Candida verbasci]|uniref:DNA 3'-5' helicase n=1 Tax=Candida verbasci TaxID=1227364 RepID=A0A9W4TSN9_9ASCO|nr:unnamed protein product [Candida verbasci]